MRHLLAVLLFALFAPTLWALYLRPEIEKVPVARLVENLEGMLKKDEKNVQLRFNLARLHAMAYALKSDSTEIRKGQEKEGVWFGYEPRPVPFEKIVKAEDAAKEDAARKHLEKAINLYEEVVKQKPDHLIAQLGRAWSIAQRSSKDKAIEEYRKVAAMAWDKEKTLKFAPLGFYAITAETAKYLFPLLDAEKDKDEIATLKQRSEQLNKLPRPITPIAIPLREGLSSSDLLDLSARVTFDADGSGLPRTWTWITRDAGWLVHDPKHTGKITSALQMFGSVSFWCFWDHGYQALAALDDDGDGWLRGKEVRGLAIWRDENGDGISDPGEVKPLDDWKIVALRCRADAEGASPHAVAQSQRGVTFRNGSTRPTFDFVLQQVQEVVPRDDPTKVEGDSKESLAAVAKGLLWLALHQAPNGSWSLDQFNKHARADLNSNRYMDDQSTGKGQNNDTAGAAFGVLPFLAAGVTHKGSGLKANEVYKKTVHNALSYLMQKQGKDGGFPGGMYAHALATLAICEAYGMTSDPILKRPAQSAIDYIVAAQDVQKGGWRYAPKQGSDQSVTGWHVMALKSGQMAGLRVPAATLQRAAQWVLSVKGNDFGYGYVGPNSTATMTASGLMCRLHMGITRRSPDLIKGVETLEKLSKGREKDRYHTFWTTQVMFHVGGESWDRWNKGDQTRKGYRDTLIASQDKNGSWDPSGDTFCTTGGRVMSTSLALISLQVYYKHLPLFKREGPQQ